jgi:hypothetical protein
MPTEGGRKDRESMDSKKSAGITASEFFTSGWQAAAVPPWLNIVRIQRQEERFILSAVNEWKRGMIELLLPKGAKIDFLGKDADIEERGRAHPSFFIPPSAHTLTLPKPSSYLGDGTDNIDSVWCLRGLGSPRFHESPGTRLLSALVQLKSIRRRFCS